MSKTRLETLRAALFVAAAQWINISELTVDPKAFDQLVDDLRALEGDKTIPDNEPVTEFMMGGPVGIVTVKRGADAP